MGHEGFVYDIVILYLYLYLFLYIYAWGNPAVLYERSQIMGLVIGHGTVPLEPTCLLYLTLYEFVFVSVLVYLCLGFNLCWEGWGMIM